MTRTTANMLLLLIGALWGLGFVAQSTAMDAIAPLYFTGIRFGVGALVLLPFALFESRKHDATAITRKQTGQFITLGCLLFGALAFQQVGLLTTSITNSGFLTGTYVLLVPILAVIVLRQRPHFIVWPGCLLVLAGIYLLSGGNFAALTIGDAQTLVCAVFWAAHVLYLGQVVGGKQGVFRLAFIQFTVCAVLGVLGGLAVETVNMAGISNALPEILFAGGVSGGLAFTLQAIAQRHTTASQAAIFLSSESLFAALFGAWFLSERIGTVGLLGCALIFTAILLVELLPSWQRQRTQSVRVRT